MISDYLKIPVDSPDFALVLDSIPKEGPESWDVSQQVQAGYAIAKLDKYHFSASALQQVLEKTTKGCATSSATALDKQKNPLQLGSGSSAQIKIEKPELLEMQACLKVLESAGGRLSSELTKLKRVQAEVLSVSKGDNVGMQLRLESAAWPLCVCVWVLFLCVCVCVCVFNLI